MDDGGLAAELGVGDGEEGGAGGGTVEEGNVEGERVRLVLGGERAVEVGFSDLEKGGCDIAAVGHWRGLLVGVREGTRLLLGVIGSRKSRIPFPMHQSG